MHLKCNPPLAIRLCNADGCLSVVNDLDVVIDLLVAFCLGVPCWFVHQFVVEKMQARKAQEAHSETRNTQSQHTLASPNNGRSRDQKSGGLKKAQ